MAGLFDLGGLVGGHRANAFESPIQHRTSACGVLSVIAMFRQLSFCGVSDCFQVGGPTSILILGVRSKTHLLVLVQEELSHQNGDEALVLVEHGQGYLVRQELAAGRYPRALLARPFGTSREALSEIFRGAPFPFP
jgi:hypothetical protein